MGDSHSWLFPTGLLLVLLAAFAWFQPRVTNRVWHWHQTLGGLGVAPEHFYAQVYERLHEGIQVRAMPLRGMGFGPRRLFATRTILGGCPLYLEARYQHATLYLYAAQTPSGLFVSQWLFSKYVTWLDRPVLRWFAYLYFARQSLFQFDATLMFGESVHSIVLDVLDSHLETQSLPPLPEAGRRPLLHAFYGSSPAPFQSHSHISQSSHCHLFPTDLSSTGPSSPHLPDFSASPADESHNHWRDAGVGSLGQVGTEVDMEVSRGDGMVSPEEGSAHRGSEPWNPTAGEALPEVRTAEEDSP